MSRKDYQAIARAIYEGTQDVTEPIDETGTPQEIPPKTTASAIAYRIADVMAADSPRFDRARFLEACETGTTRGMRKAG